MLPRIAEAPHYRPIIHSSSRRSPVEDRRREPSFAASTRSMLSARFEGVNAAATSLKPVESVTPPGAALG